MSANFCGKLIKFTKDYLYYKVNVLDPMAINTSFLYNCVKEKDEMQINIDYPLTLEDINSCLLEGENSEECVQVCKQYEIGKINNFFLGEH